MAQQCHKLGPQKAALRSAFGAGYGCRWAKTDELVGSNRNANNK